MTDEELIEIRDSLLPSQGEQFDVLEFGRAIDKRNRAAIDESASKALMYAGKYSDIIQAITDPENQPSQYGTITLDYHRAAIDELVSALNDMVDAYEYEASMENPSLLRARAALSKHTQPKEQA